MAFPVHDWINSALRAIWTAALFLFGNPVVSFTVAVSALLVYWGDLSPTRWLGSYLPSFTSIAGLAQFADLNQQLLEVGCYVTAADVAASLLSNLFTVVCAVADFIVVYLPTALLVYLVWAAYTILIRQFKIVKPG